MWQSGGWQISPSSTGRWDCKPYPLAMAFVSALFMCCWSCYPCPHVSRPSLFCYHPPPHFFPQGAQFLVPDVSCGSNFLFSIGGRWQCWRVIYFPATRVAETTLVSGCVQYFASSCGVKFASLYSLKCKCFVLLFYICGEPSSSEMDSWLGFVLLFYYWVRVIELYIVRCMWDICLRGDQQQLNHVRCQH